MRCDLHVHTVHSGAADLLVLNHVSRECYSQPGEVYDAAKRRGMDLVTITDHDTIAGALELAGRDDFFVGEEVSCELEGGRVLHLGVWDISEPQHAAIAARRREPERLFAYLAEQRIPAAVNHLFSPLTGPRRAEDFHLALGAVGLVEAQNGMMPPASNEFARLAGRAAGLAPIGGSDAHTVARVAHAFTTVPRARDRREFLDGLRAGFTVPAGGAGSYARLTADVLRVFAGAYRENASKALRSLPDLARFAAIAPALPILALIPLATAIAYLKEGWLARRFFSQYRATLPSVGTDPTPRLMGPKLALGGEP